MLISLVPMKDDQRQIKKCAQIMSKIKVMLNRRLLYIDAGVLRRAIRDPSYQQKLKEFFDQEEPGLFDNSNVLFTWSQLIELCDLGTVLNQIVKTDIWKNEIEGKDLIEKLGFQKGLDKYFITATNALASLTVLQKDALLKSIDIAASHAAPEAKKLVDDTLLHYREGVASDSYMIPLTIELAWAFLTSYPFIQSKNQWTKREICYKSLMALWHRLRKEGHDLVFFRLCERHYYSYLLYSPDVNMEEAKALYPGILSRQDLANRIFKFPPLKQESDLCDGEIIHFVYLGSSGLPVVGIVKGEQSKITQRTGVFDRCLSDLQTRVANWDLRLTLGEILSFEIDDEETIRAYRNLPRTTCGSL